MMVAKIKLGAALAGAFILVVEGAVSIAQVTAGRSVASAATQTTPAIPTTSAPAAHPDFSDPKRAFLSFVLALDQGDVATVKQSLAMQSSIEPMMDGMIRLQINSRALANAGRKRFDVDVLENNTELRADFYLAWHLPLKTMQDMIRSATVTAGKDNTATLQLPQGHPMARDGRPIAQMVRIGKEWKVDLRDLIPGTPPKAFIDAASKAYEQMADDMGQIATNLSAGKFKDVESVLAAISVADEKFGTAKNAMMQLLKPQP